MGEWDEMNLFQLITFPEKTVLEKGYKTNKGKKQFSTGSIWFIKRILTFFQHLHSSHFQANLNSKNNANMSVV